MTGCYNPWSFCTTIDSKCSGRWPLDVDTITTHLQFCTSMSLRVLAFCHKTPSAEASPPQACQTRVSISWLISRWSLGSPNCISSFQPQPVTALIAFPLACPQLHFYIPAPLLCFSCKVGISQPFSLVYLIHSILPGDCQLNDEDMPAGFGPEDQTGCRLVVAVLDGKELLCPRSTCISQLCSVGMSRDARG